MTALRPGLLRGGSSQRFEARVNLSELLGEFVTMALVHRVRKQSDALAGLLVSAI